MHSIVPYTHVLCVILLHYPHCIHSMHGFLQITSPEHKITAGHWPFSVHFNQMAAQATSWSVIVSRQKFPKLYNYQNGLDRNIYSHLYNLLEFYLTFYIKKRANELLCIRSCCLFNFSVAKHNESKCNCCARCPRVPVVKLIDLVCGFLVQPTSTCTSSCRVEIAGLSGMS